jgi:chromosome segregation ATPase
LSVVLLSAVLLPVSGSEEAAGGAHSLSQNELERLRSISARLSALNVTLQSALEDSRRNSIDLQLLLEASRSEAETLKNELETLKHSSGALLTSLESSKAESMQLSQDWTKAESSLRSLEASFRDYRIRAENLILAEQTKRARLEARQRALGVGLGVVGAAALTGWLLWLIK